MSFRQRDSEESNTVAANADFYKHGLQLQVQFRSFT